MEMKEKIHIGDTLVNFKIKGLDFISHCIINYKY